MIKTLIYQRKINKVPKVPTSFLSFLVLTCFISPLSLSQDNARLLIEASPIKVETIELIGGGETLYIKERNQRSNSKTPSLAIDTLVVNAEDNVLGIEQYQRSINELEQSNGPYENKLGQELESLANILHANGDYFAAIDSYSRSIHISRVNNGLFSPLQINAVKGAILSHIADGDLQAAHNQQEYLLYLKNQIHDSTDPERLTAIIEFAEWNQLAANLLLGLSEQESLLFNINKSMPTSSTIVNQFSFNRLTQATQQFSIAVSLIEANYGLADPRIQLYNKQLIYLNYILATQFATFTQNASVNSTSDLVMNSSMFFSSNSTFENFGSATNSVGYREGLKVLKHNVSILNETSVLPTEAAALALIELGDWYLSFNMRRSALQSYSDAYQELLAADVVTDRIELLLHPQNAIPIPTFFPTTYAISSSEELSADFQGYLDVELLTSRHGKLKSMEILTQSEGIPNALSATLERQLKRLRFRPRFIDGTAIDNDKVTMRYHFSK